MESEDIVSEFSRHIKDCPTCSRTRRVQFFCSVGKELVAGLDILEDRRVKSEEASDKIRGHFDECAQCGDSISIGCLCHVGYYLVDVWIDVAIRHKIGEAKA